MRNVRQDIGGLGNLLFKQAYIWAQMREGNIPDVYLQSEKYFAKYRNEIKQMFAHGITRNDFVGLHIRRGDYMKATQFHTPLWQTDYYKKAVSLFPNEKFLVFYRDRQDQITDDADADWCAEACDSLGIDWGFNFGVTETDDLNAMASCKYLIGANSSFSWWAAYLGSHEQVVFPKDTSWFTDHKVRTELLPEWTQLDI